MTLLRERVRLPAGPAAPAGVEEVAVEVVADPAALASADAPALLCCFPGGGMSATYFDLRVPGAGDGYSMAAHLAAAGHVVALIDHPGVGGSDVPDDGWSLTPEVVADVDAAAAVALIEGVRAGTLLGGLPALAGGAAVGVGHSMGAMLVALQQARHGLYAGLALIGHSGRGLPEALLPAEQAVAHDAGRIAAELDSLARARFGVPLPVGNTAGSPMLAGPDLDTRVSEGLAASGSRMLVLPGLFSMLPGSHDAELAAIEVPVLCAVAEHDITGPAADVPRWLKGSREVTRYVQPGAFHNGNTAPSRRELWDRVGVWAGGLARGASSA